MSTLNCPYCKERTAVISSHHTSERRCGFTEDGLFQPDNYCCGLLHDLRSYAELIPDIKIAQHEDDNIVYFNVGKETLKLVWYKNRGNTSGFTLDDGRPVPLITALQLLAELEEEHGLLCNLVAKHLLTPEVYEHNVRKLQRNGIYGSTLRHDNPLYKKPM